MLGSATTSAASVVYVSEAACPFDDERITELASLAAANNSSIAVTGYLYFSKGRFVQCLEGDRAVVDDLLGRIRRDSRHNVLASHWRGHDAERRFPRWSMRWVRETEMTEIGLEHLLADQVLFKSRLGGQDAGLDESIWRVVDSVAKSLHNQPG